MAVLACFTYSRLKIAFYRYNYNLSINTRSKLAIYCLGLHAMNSMFIYVRVLTHINYLPLD